MPSPSNPLAFLDEDLAAWSRSGLWRSLRTIRPGALGQVVIEGRTYVDFSSNDYLGLANDGRVVEAACRAARDFGWGAGASPLVSGWRAPHLELCEALAEFEGAEATLLFSSGFAANMGVLVALAAPGDAIYLDRLAHACLVAGARVSGARLRVFPHNDAVRLREILERERATYRRVLIATEGLFSMDGDLAPLVELAEVAESYGAALMVDEAHATGVLGRTGRGACEELGVEDRVPIRVGTLSKALGSVGGFVVGTRALIQSLIQSAPTFMFSTALPPAAAAAAHEALRIQRNEPALRERVRGHGDRLRQKLGIAHSGPGAIVPWPVGDAEAATRTATALQDHGLLVPAIRPPTVPKGSSRLRISVTAAHEASHVENLCARLLARGDSSTIVN